MGTHPAKRWGGLYALGSLVSCVLAKGLFSPNRRRLGRARKPYLQGAEVRWRGLFSVATSASDTAVSEPVPASAISHLVAGARADVAVWPEYPN